MIEELGLHNFKSAKDIKLKMAPLTVLTGLNGSGKSTVLQSLALLKQSFNHLTANNELILRGSLIQLGRAEDIQHENSEDDEIHIALKTSTGTVKIISPITSQADTLTLYQEGDFKAAVGVLFDGFQFIQADRLTPATQYLQASSPEQKSGWLGCKGEFTVDYLQRNADIKVSTSRGFPRNTYNIPLDLFEQVAPTDSLLDQTAGWLQQLSPGVRLRPVALELADANSLRFEYTGTKVDSVSRQHRPSNVGFGLTYILPIIVACLAAKPGALLLLENPEAHLHPRGQSALGLLLALCAADGVQIIVETHSDHVLNGIRVAVKQQKISANQVAIHFFSRDIESGASTVITPEVYTNGRISEWPVDFFDEWSKALDELLDD